MALTEIYQDSIPNQPEEPNAILCGKIGNWLKTHGKRPVSDATILRAAGRRRP
jgi:hypothetical protein